MTKDRAISIRNLFVFRHVWNPEEEIGIEVELEGEALPRHLKRFWSVKNDGSLRGAGVEYVLSRPTERGEVGSKVDWLYKQIGEMGEPSDRCGVHVHLNCQRLTLKQVYNIITLYLIMEEVLVHWCGEDREGNLFCLRAQDAEWLLMQLVDDKARGTITRATHHNYKYSSINIAALSTWGSLEFRALRSPPTSDRIKIWVDVLTRIKDYALKIENTEELVLRCSELGAPGILADVLGDKYADEFNNPFVDEMLMAGARRIQTLAYTELGEYDTDTLGEGEALRRVARRGMDFLHVDEELDEEPDEDEDILNEIAEIERQVFEGREREGM